MTEPTPPYVGEIYHDAEQRDEANHLGMWTFIATEVLFFGGLFLAYIVYRVTYHAAFVNGSRRLELWIGTVNTAVLLTSSLSMAAGDAMIKQGRKTALRTCLITTVALGTVFLGFKFYEYYQKFAEHLVPGAAFRVEGPAQTQLFFVLYFAMTGLHAVHMLIGIGAMAWLIVGNERGRFSSRVHAPVEIVGLYWHFVDCVWVFLYPLLYLVR